MRILLYITFIILYGLLLFRLPAVYPKKKALQITGVGILGGFLFFIIAPYIFFLLASKYDPQLLIHKKLIFNICMGIISLFFFSFFVLFFVDTIVDNVLIRFHQMYNVQNLDRNPVKFVIRNAGRIKLGIKLFFFLGGFIMYYGICFDTQE